jgi:glucose-fructose oxidoreductase
MDEGITRRGVVATGLAGLAIPARAAPVDERVGIALVGLGKLTQGQLLPALRTCRRARLAALVSGDPAKARRLAAENGLPPTAVYDYAGFDRIAADPAIEVVYIVLPDGLHADYTVRALRAGKHVLCEKPMATSVAEGERMVAEARTARRQLMVAYRCHYEPLNLAAMRLLRAGRLGRIRAVSANMGRQADPADPSDRWRLDGKLSGGGALTDMGIYGINAMRYLLAEEPVAVRAWTQTDPADPRFREVPDQIAWQFRFPSGAIGSGSTSFSQASAMSWEVTGERGRLIGDPACFYGGNQLRQIGGGEAPAFRQVDQFAREMDWMADVVRGRAPLVSPGEEGLQDLRLIRAIRQSADGEGRTVAVDWRYARQHDPATAVTLT